MGKAYDLIVVGSGPAGASAAIYAKRNGVNVAVVDSGTMGGQLSFAYEIENYLGIPKMTGQQWSELTKKHLDRIGIEIILDAVSTASTDGGRFSLTLSSGKTLSSSALIIATGAAHRHLGADGEEKFFGRGISYCATCDGYFFRGKDVAVVGGGNTALTYALFLSGIASKVYLVHRREGFRAEKAVVDEVLSNPKIIPLLSKVPVKFSGSEVLQHVELRDTASGEISKLDVSGAFIAVGTVPQSALAVQLGAKVSVSRHVEVDENCKTSVDGLYAAGDVTVRGRAQAIHAAAEGMVAGIEASSYLRKRAVGERSS